MKISARAHKTSVIVLSLSAVFVLFQNFSSSFTDTDTILLEYIYDKNENILEIRDEVNPGFSQKFTYDGVSRLTGASYPQANLLNPVPVNSGGEFAYNETGDLTSYVEFEKARRNLSIEATNRRLISSVSGSTIDPYYYDDLGRMTGTGRHEFTYRADDLLVQARDKATGLTVEYTYDGLEKRVSKKVTSIANNPRTTYSVYTGNTLLFEGSQGGGIANESKEYFYSGDSLVGARKVSTDASCTANCPATISYQYYHFNPVRSTIGISNEAGVMARERYNAYGSPLEPSGKTNPALRVATSIRFAGHVIDDEIGLIYMGARFYDPKLGRFISMDPVGFKSANIQSFNKYAYANNNPNRFIDPDGREAIQSGQVTQNRVQQLQSSRTYTWTEGKQECFQIFALNSPMGYLLPHVTTKGGGDLYTQTAGLQNAGYTWQAASSLEAVLETAKALPPGTDSALLLNGPRGSHIINLYTAENGELVIRDFQLPPGASQSEHLNAAVGGVKYAGLYSYTGFANKYMPNTTDSSKKAGAEDKLSREKESKKPEEEELRDGKSF